MELGGPDYAKTAPKITDSEGNEVLDSRGPGYRYFGAAKQLPGVKELFEKEAPKQVGWLGKEVHCLQAHLVLIQYQIKSFCHQMSSANSQFCQVIMDQTGATKLFAKEARKQVG